MLCSVIDHFTIVCSVTWPLNGSEAGSNLVFIQISLFLLCESSCSDALTRDIDIKARSPPASLPFKGQVTEQTTVESSIQRQQTLLALYVNCPFQIMWCLSLYCFGNDEVKKA